MAKITIVFAILLILLGFVGFYGTPAKKSESNSANTTLSQKSDAENSTTKEKQKRSATAFIPSGFGLLMLVCGVIALKESLRKHAMHGAVLIGLIGFLAGAGRGTMSLGKVVSGDPSMTEPRAIWTLACVWMMAIICAVFVALCVRSFVKARQNRENESVDENASENPS